MTSTDAMRKLMESMDIKIDLWESIICEFNVKDSTYLATIDYNETTGDVVAVAHDGETITVRGGGEELYNQWIEAPSAGKFFHQVIKGSYEFEKTGGKPRDLRAASFIEEIKVQGNTVFLKMKSGPIYKYEDLPPALVMNWKMAPVLGKFFNERVKGKFPYEKITSGTGHTF